MANSKKAIDKVLRHEGGYVCDKDDPGGETIYGITRRYNPAWPGWEIVDEYKPDEIKDVGNNVFLKNAARTFYLNRWVRYKMDSFSQKTAEVFFDTMINMGIKTTVRMVQETFNRFFSGSFEKDLKVDGIIGPKTISAVKSVREQSFVNSFIQMRIERYFLLCRKNRKLYKFILGWIRRAMSFVVK